MTYIQNLGLFFATIGGIILLPGMDMAFVVSSTMAWGRRRGFLAVSGIVAGGAIHMLMAACGLIILMKLFPSVFKALLVAGALYMVWVGVSLLRIPAGDIGSTGRTCVRKGIRNPFAGALLTCLINPKAYLFTLALLPQFIKPEFGPITLQILPLAVITALTQTCVYGAAVVVFSHPMSISRGRIWVWPMERIVGGLLVVLAIATVARPALL